MDALRQGPLAGLNAVLLGGIGPAPYAAMLLADLGVRVTRIERPASSDADNPLHPPIDIFGRGQQSVQLDLRSAEGCDAAWALIEEADILIEGFRPGVIERFGFAPNLCLQRQPRLVIARITGYGQHGPMAANAGHDLNYLSLAGALAAMPKRDGEQGRAIPLNLLADFAGGGLWACFGILAAIHERAQSGRGQVVDAAMVDGVSSLMGMAFALRHFGSLAAKPGHSVLDGGAHFYDTYACADGREVAVGAIEPSFYEALCRLTGLDDAEPSRRFEPSRWPGLKRELADRLSRRSRASWLADADAATCITPVLDLDEVADHPHHLVRQSFITNDTLTLPAPGPRFSRTPAALPEGYHHRRNRP